MIIEYLRREGRIFGAMVAERREGNDIFIGYSVLHPRELDTMERAKAIRIRKQGLNRIERKESIALALARSPFDFKNHTSLPIIVQMALPEFYDRARAYFKGATSVNGDSSEIVATNTKMQDHAISILLARVSVMNSIIAKLRNLDPKSSKFAEQFETSMVVSCDSCPEA